MKNICRKIIGLILILMIISSANLALAVSQAEINAQKNQQSQINSQIDEAEEKQKQIETEKSKTMQQVENISSQLDSYESQIDDLNSQIDDANAKIKESQEKLTQNEEEYKKKQETLKQRLVVIYESGETSYLDVLLNSSSLTDFISNYYLVSELTEMDTQLMEGLEKQKKEIEASKQEIETSKAQLTNAKSSKESVSSELKTAKSEKDKYVAQLSGEEAQLQKEIDELKNHESSISSKIKKMQQEYDEQIKKNNNTSNSSKNNSSNNSSINNGTSSYGFGWPVSNHSIGTGYGVSGKYWSSGYHTGIDFPVSSGTPVYAVGNGQVFDTGYNYAYGNFVEIYHGNNLYSYYAHGSSVQVSIGQNVSKGQQIMLSGSSGNVTGAHLHFEIRTPGYRYANCVNPRTYLP